MSEWQQNRDKAVNNAKQIEEKLLSVATQLNLQCLNTHTRGFATIVHDKFIVRSTIVSTHFHNIPHNQRHTKLNTLLRPHFHPKELNSIIPTCFTPQEFEAVQTLLGEL